MCFYVHISHVHAYCFPVFPSTYKLCFIVVYCVYSLNSVQLGKYNAYIVNKSYNFFLNLVEKNKSVSH